MAEGIIEISSAEHGFEVFEYVARKSEIRGENFRIVGNWAATRVRIPDPPISSSISPVMMEAYLEIQKELFRFAALAKTGMPRQNQLSELDRRELEFLVRVTEGSSQHLADFTKPIENLGKKLIAKLTGRQVTIISLGLALIFGSYHGWSAWLEYRKSIVIEEIRNSERIEVLNALKFASEQQRRAYEFVFQTMTEQGMLGRRAGDVVENSFTAVLRAAERSDPMEINGERITSTEAALLRLSSRSRPVMRFSSENMRVVDINTAADIDAIVFMRPETKEQFRVRFSETLFSYNDRERLFSSLENRTVIFVELAFREVNGQVRETHFVRVLD